MDTSIKSVAENSHPKLDDTDLRCLVALQSQPRATWRELAAQADVAERTLARRLTRLIEGKWVRIIAEMDPWAAGAGPVMHAWIRCRSGAIAQVAEQLSALSQARVVVALAGDADVMAEFNLRDDAELRHMVTEQLPAIPGVESVASRLVLRPFRRAGQWRIDPGAQSATLPSRARQPLSLSDGEARVLAHLAADGRATVSDLAQSSGVSEPTILRSLQALSDSGSLNFRVEIEPSLLGFGVEALISVRARPDGVEALAEVLAADPHTRCLFGTSGTSQLFWHVVCRDSMSLWELVTQRLGQTDGALSSDTNVVVQAYKRCGIARKGMQLQG